MRHQLPKTLFLALVPVTLAQLTDLSYLQLLYPQFFQTPALFQQANTVLNSQNIANYANTLSPYTHTQQLMYSSLAPYGPASLAPMTGSNTFVSQAASQISPIFTTANAAKSAADQTRSRPFHHPSASEFSVEQFAPPLAFRPTVPVPNADISYNDQQTLRQLNQLADEESSLTPQEIEARASSICRDNAVCQTPPKPTHCSDADYVCQFERVCSDCAERHQPKCLHCLRLKLIPSSDKSNQIKVACRVCELTQKEEERPKICESMKCL